MIKIINYLLGLLWLLVPAYLTAQDIVSVDDNIYSTARDSVVMVRDNIKQVQISASSHLSGEIKIQTGTAGRVTAVYRKMIKIGNESLAQEFADLIKIEMIEESDQISVYLRTPNPAPWAGTDESGRLIITLYLPENSDCKATVDYFDIEVKGPLNSFICDPTFGRIKVRKISEKVDVTGKGQRIYLSEVGGEISARSHSGDIKIGKLKALTTPALLRNENGNIVINDVDGHLDIRNEYGKLIIDKWRLTEGSSRIVGNHAPINISIFEVNNSTLEIDNSNEDITIAVPEDVSAQFDLEIGEGGEMHVTDIPVVPQLVMEERLKFYSADKSSLINVHLEGSGTINVEGESD